MYDVDGNGWIDMIEMTKIVKSIYKMMGPNQLESPAKRAEDIFRRMDANGDGRITRQEFVRFSLNDPKLMELLSPNSMLVYIIYQTKLNLLLQAVVNDEEND